MTCKLRPATREDAPALAELVDLAGQGLPYSLWSRQTDSQKDALAVGAEHVARDDGPFSWRKAIVADMDGAVAGMILTHVTPKTPVPFDEDTPPVFRPLVHLENKAPATRLIDALATFPAYRHRGIAKSLIAEAERHPGENGMAFVTPDANREVRRFYDEMGYREEATFPIVHADWKTSATAWVLMRKH